MNAYPALDLYQFPGTMNELSLETAHDSIPNLKGTPAPRVKSGSIMSEQISMRGRVVAEYLDPAESNGYYYAVFVGAPIARDRYWSDVDRSAIHSGLLPLRAEWKDAVIRKISKDSRNWPDVDEKTAKLAKRFVKALPDDIEAPDVEPTPQGEIDFSWDDDDVTFGVMVLPTGDLGMAGMFNEMKLYGNTHGRTRKCCRDS